MGPNPRAEPSANTHRLGKSWRGERPQEGRFREFTQADIDVVDIGSLPAHFEAEMPIVIAEIFEQLPVGDFRVRCNNRKIPQGFYLGIGLTDIVPCAPNTHDSRASLSHPAMRL